jgi:hypothetical protein
MPDLVRMAGARGGLAQSHRQSIASGDTETLVEWHDRTFVGMRDGAQTANADIARQASWLRRLLLSQ